MSLINDALKKARQAQTATSATAAGPSLRPVEPVRPPRNPILTLPFVLALVLVLILAGVLFAQWYRGASDGVEVRAKAPAQPAVAASDPSPKTPEPAQPATPTPALVDTPLQPPTQAAPEPIIATEPPAASVGATNTSAAISSVTNADLAVAPTPPPVEPPSPPLSLKLQGIFFNPRQPAALINGRTVFIGSEFDEARVTAINQRSVTVVTPAGRTNILKLEEH